MPVEYQNVAQPYSIYDSIGVVTNLEDFGRIPPGWVSSFSNLGSMGDLHFFNMRNRADGGLPYNNQDSRDLMDYAFFLKQISVSFCAPAVAGELIDNGYATNPSTYAWANYEVKNSAIWSAELPQHCGFELKINQDIHLKTNAAMVGSNVGPVGGGFGNLMSATHGINYAANLTAFNSGEPSLDNCWTFPKPIGVPRKSAISVIIRPSEWARELLQAMNGPGGYPIAIEDGYYSKIPCLYTIRVALHGTRLIQQRGEYHA